MFLFLLASIALAEQQDCSLTNFQPCLDVQQLYLEGTCNPLQAKNITYFQACECYHAVNLGYCYKQCPGNTDVQNQLITVVQPSVTQLCGAVNLNPARLPAPPIWETWFAQTTSPNTTTAATNATNSSTGSVVTAPKSNSAVGLGGSVVAGLFGLLLA